jgi:transcriptional regulator with XRE-family HTH domain
MLARQRGQTFIQDLYVTASPFPFKARSQVYAPQSHTGGPTMPTKKPLASETQTFGQRLAKLRRDAGYSQSELGRQLGISQRMVAYYEGQTEHPPAQLLPGLAEILGVSTDVLLGVTVTKASGRASNQRLWRRFKEIEKLPATERRQLLGIVDAVLERHKLVQRAG